MALNFPSNPTLYQTYVENNTTYVWQGSKWAISQNAFTTLHKEKSAIQYEEVFDLSNSRTFSVDLVKNASTNVSFINPPENASKVSINIKKSNMGNIDIGSAEPDGVIFDFTSLATSPVATEFSSDGTKFYVLSQTNQRIYQFGMDTPWDTSTYYYERKSYAVNKDAAGLETVPYGFYIKPDGTKFYIIGTNTKTVRQYTMTTPWDISTGVYDAKFFSVNNENTGPVDIHFSPDGTKMYILGSVSPYAVYQYTLNIPWELNTGTVTYGGIRVLLVSAETAPTSLEFNATGTMMYVMGITQDRIYQYPINPLFPWDLTYATGTPTSSISFASTDGSIYGMSFGNNGNLLYLTGTSTNALYTYTLSVPYTVDSGTLTLKNSISLIGQGSTRTCIRISTDGKKLYMADSGTDLIYQYTMRTPWDINTMNYDNISFSVAGQESSISGMHFKPDGTAFYIIGVAAGALIYQYSMSTPWDLTTAGYTGNSGLTTSGVPNARLTLNSTGTKVYVVYNSNVLIQHNLTTPWEIRTISAQQTSFSIDTSTRDLYISEDQRNFFVLGGATVTNDLLYQYYVPTIGSVSGLNNNVTKILTGFENPESMYFSADMSKMYILNSSGVLHQFTITEGAWKVTNAIPNKNANFVMTTQNSAMGCFFINNAGTIMITIGNTNPCTIFRYTLTTPWDTSTATPTLGVGNIQISKYIGNIITTASSVQVSPDGINLFILQASIIYKYIMSIPWDLTTAVFTTGDTFTISTAQDTTPTCIRFRADGLMMYVMGSATGILYQYQLTVPWDIKSSMTYTTKSRTISAGTAQKITISSDGKYLIANSSTNSILSSWYFGAAWDVTTLVNRTSISFSSTMPDMTASPDGSTLYAIISANTISQFTIFDVSPSINWPSNIVWQGGAAPDLPDKKQSMQIDLYSTDGGITYFAHTKMARLFSPADLY
jgi:sugar lactone lactonase YvrE